MSLFQSNWKALLKKSLQVGSDLRIILLQRKRSSPPKFGNLRDLKSALGERWLRRSMGVVVAYRSRDGQEHGVADHTNLAADFRYTRYGWRRFTGYLSEQSGMPTPAVCKLTAACDFVSPATAALIRSN